VKQNELGIFIGDHPGEIVDHAVCMRRMEAGRRMDRLLMKGLVSTGDMDALAHKIARFHQSAQIIYNKDARDIPEKFADLASEEFFLQQHLSQSGLPSISQAVRVSDAFCEKHAWHIRDRAHRGFIRDCHGDLHTRNIFLLTTPQPFDCIEFSDELREIDVLNEVAFLCMDLEAFGRHDLSQRFLRTYNAAFPSLETPEDQLLLQYYKSYRANVRAKIYSLAARNAPGGDEQAAALEQAGRYLALMNGYLQKLMTCQI
jgi:aminoglycoside phosphotransferase family enzyme